MCCLKHCAALWQLLASLKSENMLRLKRVRHRRSVACGRVPALLLITCLAVSALQDPFPGVPAVYKEALGEEEHRLLTTFFSKNSADTFLLEMHEFLVLVLKKPNPDDTFKPDWG